MKKLENKKSTCPMPLTTLEATEELSTVGTVRRKKTKASTGVSKIFFLYY